LIIPLWVELKLKLAEQRAISGVGHWSPLSALKRKKSADDDVVHVGRKKRWTVARVGLELSGSPETGISAERLL